jgi:hypothetical protein
MDYKNQKIEQKWHLNSHMVQNKSCMIDEFPFAFHFFNPRNSHFIAHCQPDIYVSLTRMGKGRFFATFQIGERHVPIPAKSFVKSLWQIFSKYA